MVEQDRIVHERVDRVNNIFIGDCPPSVVRELLDFLDPLHQLLERSVRVPRLRQLLEISDNVLIFQLLVLREYVYEDVPHLDMGKSPTAIKYWGKKFFVNCLCDLLSPCTLKVDPFLEFPRCLRMAGVEVYRGDAICPRWDDELA